MYTSCGWFFDELSGIETMQVLQYAGRVIQLARETGNMDAEPEFLRRLPWQKQPSELGDGAVFTTAGWPGVRRSTQSGSAFLPSAQCLMVTTSSAVLLFGKAMELSPRRKLGAPDWRWDSPRVTSRITRNSRAWVCRGLPGRSRCCTQACVNSKRAKTTTCGAESMAAFSSGDFGELLRLLDDHFDGMPYSSRPYSRTSKKRILDIVLFSARCRMRKPVTTQSMKSTARSCAS